MSYISLSLTVQKHWDSTFVKTNNTWDVVSYFAIHHMNHKVVLENKLWWNLFDFSSTRRNENHRENYPCLLSHTDQSLFSQIWTLYHTSRRRDSFSIFPLTFSANHSHCKRSAIKHWPAGDKELSSSRWCSVCNVPSIQPAGYGFIAPHIPFISACFPATAR